MSSTSETHMDLGTIFSGLTFAGIDVEEEFELGDIGDLGDATVTLMAQVDHDPPAERGARRKKRKTRRKGRKTRRSVRRTLRQSTRGLKGKEKRQARRTLRQSSRKAIRARRKSTRKALRQSRGLKGTQQPCHPGARRTTATGKKRICTNRGWVVDRTRTRVVRHPLKRVRPLPRTSEEAMALAIEAQYQPVPYATPEQAYQAEQQSYQPESLDTSAYSTYPGGGDGGGGMEPYQAEMPAGAEEAYDEEEGAAEEEGPNKLLIGGILLAVLGGAGFYAYKKKQSGEPLFGGDDADFTAADLP